MGTQIVQKKPSPRREPEHPKGSPDHDTTEIRFGFSFSVRSPKRLKKLNQSSGRPPLMRIILVALVFGLIVLLTVGGSWIGIDPVRLIEIIINLFR